MAGQGQQPAGHLLRVLGPDAVRLVAAGAALIVITCCNAGVMVASRVLCALADDRLFPSVAGRVNRGGSPWVALAMTFIAALGQGHDFVRVDFYDVPGQPLFGEYCLYPGSGLDPFDPVGLDDMLGDKWRAARAALGRD